MCASGHSCIVYTNKALVPERTAEMDEALRNWIINAANNDSGFLMPFAKACVRANIENWEILRPAAEIFREKYPKYDKA